MLHEPSLRIPFLLAIVLSNAALGAVITVDDDAPADFSDLQSAIDAAADGDVILVRAGAYSAFNIAARSLVISSDGGVTTIAGGSLISNVAAGQSVVIRGLRVVFPSPATAVTVVDCDGGVMFEDCAWNTDAPPNSPVFFASGAALLRCANVSFARCELVAQAGLHGLVAEASHAALYDCELAGADLGTQGIGADGGNGALIIGGTLTASGCSFSGGVGNAGGDLGIFGGLVPGGDGGDGVRLNPLFGIGAVARFVDCTFSPGQGGPAGSGPAPGQHGQNVQVGIGTAVFFPGPSRHFEIGSPVTAGQSASLDIDAQPGEAALLLYGPNPDGVYFAAAAGTLVPDPVTAVFVGFVPTSGTLQLNPSIPTLPASVDAAHVVAQAALGTSAGLVRLAAPSSLLVLRPGV